MSSLLVSSVLLSIASVIPVDGSPLGKPVKRQFANSSSKEPAPATSAKDARMFKTPQLFDCPV
jgi:hypothetical protein